MSEPAVSPPRAPAVFTQGSLARHVLVMTSTGSIGLVAVFMVDLLPVSSVVLTATLGTVKFLFLGGWYVSKWMAWLTWPLWVPIFGLGAICGLL